MMTTRFLTKVSFKHSRDFDKKSKDNKGFFTYELGSAATPEQCAIEFFEREVDMEWRQHPGIGVHVEVKDTIETKIYTYLVGLILDESETEDYKPEEAELVCNLI